VAVVGVRAKPSDSESNQQQIQMQTAQATWSQKTTEYASNQYVNQMEPVRPLMAIANGSSYNGQQQLKPNIQPHPSPASSQTATQTQLGTDF
jgi:hypothetical protein